MLDWTQLWLLNELICSPRPLSHLIHAIHRESGGYWGFPARQVALGSPDARLVALRHAMELGLINCYPLVWLQDKSFGDCVPLIQPEAVDLDSNLLEKTEAVISQAGHQQWEAGFQPDWARYWNVLTQHFDEQNNEWILSILYSSDGILDDLLRWFPAYWGLDDQLGLKELSCHSIFQYQAALWKNITRAKVVQCKGYDALAGINQKMRVPAASNLVGSEAREARKITLERFLQNRRLDSIHARRILNQLSKKWKCVPESTSDNLESDPEELRV